ESVKAYAAHEKGVFEEVAEARAKSIDAESVGEAVDAERAMRGALGRLFAVAEAYPQLRASENFPQLSEEPPGTEDKIAAAPRGDHYTWVPRYTRSQQTFPTALIGGAFGFTPREFFELEDEGERAAVKVEL